MSVTENEILDDKAFEPVEVILSHTPRRIAEVGVRRKTDVKLFANFTPAMEAAAQEIRVGFCSITEGLGFKPPSWERLDITTGSSASMRDYISDCTTYFWRWSEEMARYKVPRAPILDVLVFGHSCRLVDEARRKRNGWTKGTIDEGLKIYCKERGWT